MSPLLCHHKIKWHTRSFYTAEAWGNHKSEKYNLHICWMSWIILMFILRLKDEVFIQTLELCYSSLKVMHKVYSTGDHAVETNHKFQNCTFAWMFASKAWFGTHNLTMGPIFFDYTCRPPGPGMQCPWIKPPPMNTCAYLWITLPCETNRPIRCWIAKVFLLQWVFRGKLNK